MLSYEDSKRLKDSGYPQELKEGDWFWLVADRPPQLYRSCAETLFFGEGGYQKGQEYVYVKVPTTDGMWDGLWKNIHAVDLSQIDYIKIISVCHVADVESDGFGQMAAALEQALCELWKKVKSVPSSK